MTEAFGFEFQISRFLFEGHPERSEGPQRDFGLMVLLQVFNQQMRAFYVLQRNFRRASSVRFLTAQRQQQIHAGRALPVEMASPQHRRGKECWGPSLRSGSG